MLHVLHCCLFTFFFCQLPAEELTGPSQSSGNSQGCLEKRQTPLEETLERGEVWRGSFEAKLRVVGVGSVPDMVIPRVWTRSGAPTCLLSNQSIAHGKTRFLSMRQHYNFFLFLSFLFFPPFI